jgi:hypothetical protein
MYNIVATKDAMVVSSFSRKTSPTIVGIPAISPVWVRSCQFVFGPLSLYPSFATNTMSKPPNSTQSYNQTPVKLCRVDNSRARLFLELCTPAHGKDWYIFYQCCFIEFDFEHVSFLVYVRLGRHIPFQLKLCVIRKTIVSVMKHCIYIQNYIKIIFLNPRNENETSQSVNRRSHLIYWVKSICNNNLFILFRYKYQVTM